MLAVIAGLGTMIGLNAVLAVAYGIACGSSQFLNMLLRFSYLAWPFKLVAWFGCAWAGLSVGEALA
ncbi:hypothetical protein O9Z70_08150 [Devosia sp. YIM 151766]|uniref:hypothetical protein n=1 Tax=Devosia sp. YIM 151766 TaxID=3017325 RepID=UPI00255CB416|nr:hypothetical protein [Devosia sp. YIM 151766]WIY51466.1 hypothetical protein O9Z70_08150 [Devosia sp. YIM 151766]